MTHWLKEIAWLTAVFALAATVRYAWIEPAQISFHCLDYDAPFWCPLRAHLIALTALGICGGVSLIAGIIATVLRWRGLARLAMGLGCAGLVLYNYEFGTVGLLLGALVLARPRYTQHTQRAEQT